MLGSHQPLVHLLSSHAAPLFPACTGRHGLPSPPHTVRADSTTSCRRLPLATGPRPPTACVAPVGCRDGVAAPLSSGARAAPASADAQPLLLVGGGDEDMRPSHSSRSPLPRTTMLTLPLPHPIHEEAVTHRWTGNRTRPLRHRLTALRATMMATP